MSNSSPIKPLTLSIPSRVRTLASLLSYTPRISMPFSRRISFTFSTISDLNLSIPKASDSTTSTSEYLSITSPGRKSASPNIRRHAEVSTVLNLYSTAALTLSSINVSSTTSVCLLSILTVILDFLLINPIPMK